MQSSQLVLETRLSPLASIHIPPVLMKDARALAAQDIHPAWRRLEQRGHHFIISTNSLDDLTEVADWAKVALVEPEEPLTKARRQAYQAVLNRAARWAILEPLGDCHVIATKWKPAKPAVSYKRR